MKKLAYILILLLPAITYCQQDPLYNQYQFNQLMINPAYAGMYNRLSVGAITRFQWAGIDGAPQTSTITAQTGINGGKAGIGGIVLNDRFGVSSNYEIQFIGSYNINMRDARFAMGIQGGLVQYGYDFSGVEFDFFDDPEIMQGHDNIIKPNFGVGFMYMNQNFFAGASIPRILNSSVSDGVTTSERYKRHYYFTTGFAKEINRMPFKVMALVRSFEGDAFSFDLTGSVYLDMVMWAGISVRDLKHFGVFGIIDASDNIQIGYSFEMPSNSLVYGNYGTHEVSVKFNFNVSRRSMFQEKYF
ncbi:PorP/SprF family type IX secretion system membrane protein [Ekhidna sp.]